MNFDDIAVYVVLSMTDDMYQNIVLIDKLITPLKDLYKKQNKIIILTYTLRNEYRISVVEEGTEYSFNTRTDIVTNKSITVFWKKIMMLVHMYSIKHPRTYYVEKYFDLSAIVDNNI